MHPESPCTCSYIRSSLDQYLSTDSSVLRPGFADVGPKVLIRYYYHSYGAQFLCWRLSLGEDGKSPTY